MAITALSSFDCRDAARLFFRAFPSLAWTKRRALEWIKWHNEDGRVFGYRGASGRLAGFAITRCLEGPGDVNDLYSHSEKGKILWVDTLIGPRSMWSSFVHQAFERFGVREFIGFARGFRHINNTPKFYSFNLIYRL